MKQYAKLIGIDCDHPITKESDSEFLYLLQNGLLLALQEQGILRDKQYCHAEEKLRAQHKAPPAKKPL